jgi:hypothetical protein
LPEGGSQIPLLFWERTGRNFNCVQIRFYTLIAEIWSRWEITRQKFLICHWKLLDGWCLICHREVVCLMYFTVISGHTWNDYFAFMSFFVNLYIVFSSHSILNTWLFWLMVSFLPLEFKHMTFFFTS